MAVCGRLWAWGRSRGELLEEMNRRPEKFFLEKIARESNGLGHCKSDADSIDVSPALGGA